MKEIDQGGWDDWNDNSTEGKNSCNLNSSTYFITFTIFYNKSKYHEYCHLFQHQYQALKMKNENKEKRKNWPGKKNWKPKEQLEKEVL